MSKNAWRLVFIRFVLLMQCMITSGILVVLPANPICYNKVCSCRYDKDGKVLVMRICYQSVEKGIVWSWQECTEEDGIAPHRKKKCGQNDQDISQAQASAHSRPMVEAWEQGASRIY